MTAKETLYKKCEEKGGCFLSGQVGWIIEAMEDYAAQVKPLCFTEEQLNEIENRVYKEGRESVSITDFNRD